MPYATRDGLKLYYEQVGAGTPPFVFVPGWCCDHTLFEPQVAHFGTRSSAVSYDLRGCGRSDGGDDYEVATLADDLAWVCDELGVGRAIVVGHSLGALIAVELVARYPHLVAAIVAVDPGPFDPLPASRERFSALAARIRDPNEDDPRPEYVASMFRPGDDLARAARVATTMCSPTRETAASMLEGYLRWNGSAALAGCIVPMLVVLSSLAVQTSGSNDPARLLALKPDLEISAIVGAGHFLQLDAADQLTPMIERFVRDVS
ncbi:MAG TPA: alpha/beta hydrolase [Gaiellaceae bacterium]|nr:alpha/beta hydrolase [Gaiellaceae bacterium]